MVWKADEHILEKFLVPSTNHLIRCYSIRTVTTVLFRTIGLMAFVKNNA